MNWEHCGISVHVSGSARVEFPSVKLPLDIFDQARDTVRVLLGARKAETEWQPSRRICHQGGRGGGVLNLEWFKADAARWVGVRYGIF